MALELLEAVRSAEEAADAIRRDAAEQARDMVKSVEEATIESARQTAAELRASYQEAMNACRAEIERAIAGNAGKKQEELSHLRARASSRADAAAALIVERVLGHGDR
jgi:hypothetical protein